MPREEKPIYFDPSRFDLDSTGDVSVGAFAHRQWRRQIAIGLIGAAMIAGAIVIYLTMRPNNDSSPADRYPIRTQCLSCGYRSTYQVQYDQTFPMKCPSCGETAVQPVWRCRACGHEFVPDSRGTAVKCPLCNSERVGSAAAP